MEQSTSAPVQIFVVDSVVRSPRLFQGHYEVRLTGSWRSDKRDIPAGWFAVSMRKNPIVAAYLLEPQSDDGLVTWNFFDKLLRSGAEYPVLRAVLPPGIRF
jgi:hypothetical protein